jgi:hypothetical protein
MFQCNIEFSAYTKHPGHIHNLYNLYAVHKYFQTDDYIKVVPMIIYCKIYTPRGSRVPWNRGHRCRGWCLHLAFWTTRPQQIIPVNNRGYYNINSRIRGKNRRDGCLHPLTIVAIETFSRGVHFSRVRKKCLTWGE